MLTLGFEASPSILPEVWKSHILVCYVQLFLEKFARGCIMHQVVVAYLSPFCVWFRIGKCGNDFLCRSGGSVVFCNARDLCVLQEEFNTV